MGAIFETLIIQPIFNLLVFVYALVPGHNFGLALIVFTIIIRFLMWPLVKKQLHHTKKMRALQPELKKVKKAAKGDRQKEATMMMELYKERGFNPFGSIGVLIVQMIILIGLYQGLIRIIDNPQAIIEGSYAWLANLAWMKELANNINMFDMTLFGAVDLTRAALGSGGVYLPALIIVIGSAVSQYYQMKQLSPVEEDARGLKEILKEAKTGKQADQSEVNAAVGRGTRYFIPGIVFIVTVYFPSALALYWFTGGLVAFGQQYYILKRDEEELEEVAGQKSEITIKKERQNKPAKKTQAAGDKTPKPQAKRPKKKTSHNKKRRK